MLQSHGWGTKACPSSFWAPDRPSLHDRLCAGLNIFSVADRTREARMPRSKTPPESTLANEVAVFCRVKTSPIGIVVLEATAACSKTKAVIAPPTKWHIKLQLLVPSAGYARAECSLHAAFHANGCLASWHHSSFALMGSLARALQTHGRLRIARVTLS